MCREWIRATKNKAEVFGNKARVLRNNAEVLSNKCRLSLVGCLDIFTLRSIRRARTTCRMAGRVRVLRQLSVSIR